MYSQVNDDFTRTDDNVHIWGKIAEEDLRRPVYIYATGRDGGVDPQHAQTKKNIAELEARRVSYVIVVVKDEEIYPFEDPAKLKEREEAVGEAVLNITRKLREIGFTYVMWRGYSAGSDALRYAYTQAETDSRPSHMRLMAPSAPVLDDLTAKPPYCGVEVIGSFEDRWNDDTDLTKDRIVMLKIRRIFALTLEHRRNKDTDLAKTTPRIEVVEHVPNYKYPSRAPCNQCAIMQEAMQKVSTMEKVKIVMLQQKDGDARREQKQYEKLAFPHSEMAFPLVDGVSVF